jgi:hypothetical protein
VVSLQERLHELEALNACLERRLAAAAATSSSAALAAAQAGVHEAGLAAPGWASVSSSGPAAELTAADLAAGQPQPQPATTAAAGAKPGSKADLVQAIGPADGLDTAGGSGSIPAHRPVAADPAAGPAAAAAAPAAPGPAAAGNLRGSIDQGAAQQLRTLVAQLCSQQTPEQLAQEHAELASDWDKPFDLTDAEKAQFRALLPHEASGAPHVLTGAPADAQV